MTFGEVPLDAAAGAILAHSVTARTDGAAGGKVHRIPKGTVLGPREIADIAAAGIETVSVARLDADDLHEDAAAIRLADAVLDGSSGLTASAATTGRVNLRAAGPGVIALDAEAIHAANRINPGITIATVPPWQRLDANGLAATIKIIPYGVPEADVMQAAAAARGAMALRAPQIKTASLIETELDGARDLGTKGRISVAGRLERLAVSLSPRIVVPHEPQAIAAALQDAPGQMKLILTGSATSDVADIAPQAVQHAGGQVAHYGMPVDPGNLLFFGDISGDPVIGLPGCARAPALNGADWVLERLICGVPLTGADIAAMGVGGLLKEIPSRPLPRSRIDAGGT